ncbi:MAG: hypothetical protein ACJAVA_000314 [Flavobacteriaceae bacterium]|jgi:hypothetical protein
MAKKLTVPQNNLYTILLKYMTFTNPMNYANLKNLSEFKTFDSTFNALLNKGHVQRFKEGDGQNTYILTK